MSLQRELSFPRSLGFASLLGGIQYVLRATHLGCGCLNGGVGLLACLPLLALDDLLEQCIFFVEPWNQVHGCVTHGCGLGAPTCRSLAELLRVALYACASYYVLHVSHVSPVFRTLSLGSSVELALSHRGSFGLWKVLQSHHGGQILNIVSLRRLHRDYGAEDRGWIHILIYFLKMPLLDLGWEHGRLLAGDLDSPHPNIPQVSPELLLLNIV